MLDRFVDWLNDEAGLSDSTIANYSCVAKFMFGRNALGKNFGKNEFLAFCRQRKKEGASGETLFKYHKVAKQWCKFTSKKWAFKLTPPKRHRRGQLTPPFDTVMEFLQQDTGEMWNMYWLLHVNCGTRPSEVINLRVKDIDFDQRCFYPAQTKENDCKPIIIFDWIIDELRKYCNSLKSEYLFTGKYSKGKPVNLRSAENDCKKRLLMMGCNINYTPHSFRRAYATIATTKGQMPLAFIQRILRHSDIKTTISYVNADPDYIREAANMHPYNKVGCTGEIIVDEVEKYLKKKLADKNIFNQHKVREAIQVLYQSVI